MRNKPYISSTHEAGISLDGELSVDGEFGTVGQVLTSQGKGNSVTWANTSVLAGKGEIIITHLLDLCSLLDPYCPCRPCRLLDLSYRPLPCHPNR